MAMNITSSEYILPLADPRATLEVAGGKGTSLARLVTAGLPVPDGFHVTTNAYRRFVGENDLQPAIRAELEKVDASQTSTLEAASSAIQTLFAKQPIPPDVAGAIAQAYAELVGRDPAVAVRSSATAEDLPEASFAGQQETYLNVQGTQQVLEAVKRCWASLWTARAIAYRARHKIEPEGLSLAVVVQNLIPAEAAGILFTANPVTGHRDQAMISAAWGLGEAVVGGLVTPDALTVDKATGVVLDRQTADKQVMTARANGGTLEQPVPADLRRAPVLDDDVAAELVKLGVQIERLFGVPMDIEWAQADGRIFIVQARPITGLPAVEVQQPVQWELPDSKGRYMRTSIIDLIPDPLSPLFATLGACAYNDCMQQMLADLTGRKKEIFPEKLLITIHDYAYLSANYTIGELWAMLAGLIPRLPRLIRNGPDHFREVALPEYTQKVSRLDQEPVAEMQATQVWRDAKELLTAAMYHLAILQIDTLGAAAGSEGLFTMIYKKFFQREGDLEAPVFLMGYDTTPIRSEKSLYNLACWVLDKPELCDYVLNASAAQITSALAGTQVPAEIPPRVWNEWKQRVDTHLGSFGHMLYDLDFASPLPAEEPAPQLETLKMYMRGEGSNPYVRQEQLERRRDEAVAQLMQRARGLRGWAVRKALGWAQALGQVREDSYASIGLAYPRFRELMKELGRRLAQVGAFEKPDDIFWLKEVEVEDRLEALERRDRIESLQEVIEYRKKIRQSEAKLIPPPQLPPSKTYLGIPVEAFIPTGEAEQEGDRLKGVGASAGKVTGKACVLHGPQDFDQMVQGGILVAKLTTPAWTPLFAMAGGIVTDIGGPLSHGSIVAREYGIPAVLGTGVATRRIADKQTITVDGTEGIVTLGEFGS
jgi:phosphohistidine swiveling domain-containing protein